MTTLATLPAGSFDLSLPGYLITGGYLAAAVLYRRKAALSTHAPTSPLRARVGRFQNAIAAAALVLGINKQLDAQLWLNAAGRELAKAQGWYEQRFFAQLVFVVVLALAVLGALGFGVWYVRDAFPQLVLALFGLAMVLGYAMMRAISYDLVDLMVRVQGRSYGWVLEAAGVGLLLLGARR